MPTYTGCTACCGAAPDGCCPVDPPPDTRVASLAAVGCGCMTSQDMTLTRSGSTYTGSAAFGACGVSISLTFYCDGTGPLGYKLRVIISAGGPCLVQDETHSPQPESSCSPFSIQFRVTGVCICSALLTITITP